VRWPAVLCCSSLVACAGERRLQLEVTTGLEEDVFAAAPSVETVRILARDPEGEVTLQTTTAPGESFALGELTDEDVVTFELAGETAEGDVVVRGRSTAIPVGAVAATTVPMFVQRLGGFARPPGALVRAHVHAPAAVVDERFLLQFGGERAVGESGDADPALGDFYDLLSLGGGETGSVLPRTPLSLVVRTDVVFLIDEEGVTVLDRNDQSVERPPPSTLDLAAVAGGRTIESTSGRSYVVGCTKPGAANDAILAIEPDGDLSAIQLESPRSGCGATFVPEVGLVVYGGSESGAALEVVDDDGTNARSLPFGPDPTSGAALVLTSEDIVLALGGAAEPSGPLGGRFFDLRCQAACEAEIVEAALLPELSLRGEGFRTDAGALVVGEDPRGQTLAYFVALPAGEVTSLPLREPRYGATPTPTPNGLLAVLGGVLPTGAPARSIELFYPE
jgi:hypothetical protein